MTLKQKQKPYRTRFARVMKIVYIYIYIYIYNQIIIINKANNNIV